MASVYLVYIVARCWLQPSLAPPYELPPVSFVFKIVSFARYVLPIGLVIFGVIGVMFLGIATPTEAAGTGALSMFVLIAIYRRLSWQAIKKAFTGTLEVTVMVLMIIVGALTFSQILAFSGGSRGLIELATGISVAPMFVMVIMQFVIIIMGTFMEPVAIMMVTLPLFMPIIRSLNFNPVWFAVLFLMNIEVADISPPFAMELFVLKGVASPDTTMGDIYRSALPFVLLDLLCMAVVMAFPSVALWLPSMMRG